MRYGSGSKALVAVDGVDLEVPSGGTLGLVGESGCGKSSVARAIVGLLPVAQGSIHFDGVDCTTTRSRNTRSYRRRVQMVFQDPFSSLNPRMSVAEAIGEALRMRGADFRSRAARQAESIHILNLVGLSPKAMNRYPHEFSGGQRQRVAIARALAVGPQLIIADEPTSALDVSVQATILNLLKDLQRELKHSYLFISHDLSVIRFMSNTVAVMYLGRIVEVATTEELFSRPCHPYTRALISAIPSLTTPRPRASVVGDLPDPRNPPSGCRFHTRCPVGPYAGWNRSICIDQDPQILARARPHSVACHFAEDDEANRTDQTEAGASVV